MGAPKVIHGGRVQVLSDGLLQGIFHNFTYVKSLDTQDAFILGKEAPAEIGYTAQEPITGSLTAWRTLDHDATTVGLPELQDMLTADYTTLAVVDRVSGRRIGVITNVRLTGESGGHSVRQMSEISIPFKGIYMRNERNPSTEAAGASDLP